MKKSDSGTSKISKIDIRINIFIVFLFLFEFSNAQKIPKSLEISINKTDNHLQIYEFLQDNIFHILTEYPQDEKVKNDFDDLFEEKMKNLFEPNTLNYKILDLNKDKSLSNSNEFKNFKENENVEVNISTLVYIPGKVMVAPIFLNYPHLNNDIPHITLMLGGDFRSIDANYLLKSLFLDNKELKNLYNEGFIKDPKFQINLDLKDVRIIYEDKNYQEFLDNVYLVKYDSHLILNGKTKKIYS
jgi:hypothetical protein